MSRFIIAICLSLASQQALAVECGSTVNRAGCVGPNGAVGAGPNGTGSYNRNTGVERRRPYNTNEIAPGSHYEGRNGNSATKGLQQGCGYVNGRRVCD